MNCPKCNGAMWDNRDEKRSGKRSSKTPDFKCKNRSCGEVFWEDRQTNGNGSYASNGAPPSSNGRTMPHAVLYKFCVQYALKEIKPLLSDDCSDADVLAAAATLFIQASKGGVTFAPKPGSAPAAPPPPPPPPPQPQPDYSELPF